MKMSEPPLKRRANSSEEKEKEKDEALSIAISERNVRKVRELLEQGADPNYKSFGIPIVFNVKNPEILELMIQRGVDINQKNPYGQSLLEWIIGYDFTNEDLRTVLMETLLKNGADPFISSKSCSSETCELTKSCEDERCKNLLAKYQWKKLYESDKKQARDYSRNTGSPKEVWEMILLNKRQQLLCENLSSDKNKEILFLFALELGVNPTSQMSKADLCNLISRNLVK